MYLIAGLGNPGRKYKHNRHNVGFMLLDRIAGILGQSYRGFSPGSDIATGVLAGEKITLLKPLTYMNLSGSAVREIVDYFQIPVSKCLISYDEVALALGRIRFRSQGSAGGHKGMQSVIESLETKKIPRLRIGILGATPRQQLSDYVLSDFRRSELDLLDEVLDQCLQGIEFFVQHGIEKTMSQFNYFASEKDPDEDRQES